MRGEALMAGIKPGRIDYKRKCPALDFECRKDNGRSADRIAREQKWLLAKVQLLQQLVVLGKVVTLQVIEEFAASAGHLEKAAAAMKVFAMRAQVLGQMIDTGSEQRDLDLRGAGVLFVGFEFSDDFRFYDC